MKKTKGVFFALAIIVMIAVVFVACSSKPAYNDKEVTITQTVTNENGEAVTDENGQAVTEVVTVDGETATSSTDGQAVNNNTTQKSSNTNNSNQKETSTSKKNKPNKNNSTTKKNKEKATTTTEPTTLPPTTAVGNDKVDEKDIKMSVILPLFDVLDSNNYTLVVKIDKDTLKYPINDGCRGQEIEITVPKKYKGKNAVFTVDVLGRKYEVEGKIKNGSKVAFENIIIVTGEDD